MTFNSCSKDSDIFYESISEEIDDNIGGGNSGEGGQEQPDGSGDDSANKDDVISSELKAFPTAYGAGAYATGGRGGNVYHVTNLNNSGEGSFRWALGQPRPATIVFDVSGTIELTSWLTVTGRDLTIAGQTAPVGGITITTTNYSRFLFDEVENIIIRYIRIRMKDSPSVALDVYGNRGVARNLMFDHMSISYGGLQAFVIRGNESRYVTFQKGLIAESKTGALFGDSQDHHFSQDNSFINNLFYNVSHRLPNSGSNGRVDHINNVIQNWKFRLSFVNGDIKLNQINNYYCAGGRNSLGTGQKNVNALNSWHDNQIYTAGNIVDKGLFPDPDADNRQLWVEFDAGVQTDYAPASEFVDTPYEILGPPMPIKTAREAYEEIVNNPDVGANASLNGNGTIVYSPDANDREYLEVVAGGEGSYEPYTTGNNGSDRSFYFEQRYINFLGGISSNPINSRSYDYDTDFDGMPDVWERSKFGDLSRNGKEDHDGDGYSDLEEFLNLVDVD
ncbi:hypothetical protein [Flagellimonas olearia]|uniref:pectate lyase family protein n=1 Tax=Flagellimonas olearia TaxID=552546 RepID=UPI001A931197|nr:hypothetical protein [Allomuricauda olearia]